MAPHLAKMLVGLVVLLIKVAQSRNLLSQSDHLELIRNSAKIFENKTLVACVVVREPFVIYQEPLFATNTRDQIEDVENYSGVAIEILKRLAKIFKFRLRIVRPADGQFGVYLPERNSWSGLMGALVRREVDVGLTALSITLGRAQAIDFTRAYYVETAAILTRTPEEIQTSYLAIFEPFSASVWLVLLAIVLLLIALVTIMTKLEDKQREQQQLARVLTREGRRLGRESKVAPAEEASYGRHESKMLHRQSLQEVEARLQRNSAKTEFGLTWFDRFCYAVSCVINILLIRDIKHPPRQTPIRILVCVWWLSTIVIVNIYLGILFGQLVIPRRPKSIDTLEELVNQNEISWAVTRGSAIYELFRRSQRETVYGQLGERMQNVSSADEGVRSVVELGRAFIRERSILEFKVAKEHNRLRACKMQFAREDFYSVGFGLGLVKGSKYLAAFNSALTLMIENGFVSRWQSMYWPRRNQFTECKLQATEGAPLKIKHFISIYMVCSLIVALSASVLVYQHLHKLIAQT